jgi:hypothetical protein
MHISTTWGYIVILAAALIFNLYADMHPERFAPFRSLFNYIVSLRVSRFALLVIWWWLGWHFLGSLQPL